MRSYASGEPDNAEQTEVSPAPITRLAARNHFPNLTAVNTFMMPRRYFCGTRVTKPVGGRKSRGYPMVAAIKMIAREDRCTTGDPPLLRRHNQVFSVTARWHYEMLITAVPTAPAACDDGITTGNGLQ